MTEQEYSSLQEQLTRKRENSPYARTGNFKRQEGFQEGVLAAKSILSAYYHAHSEQKCQSDPHKVPPWITKLCEVVFDLALNAQHLCEAKRITVEDSRDLFSSVMQWAREFELKHSDEQGEDYIALIDEYAEDMLTEQYGASVGGKH